MNENKILITGGTGFIGETLVRELLKLNHKILIIARNYYKIFDDKNVTWISADIADEKKYIDKVKSFSPHIVFHLYWEGIPNLNSQNSRKSLFNSINFLNNIIDINSIEKIIVSGSCLEYCKNKGICKIEDYDSHETYFSWAKNSLKNWLLLRGIESNVKIYWFRIFYVFGQGQRKEALIPSIINSLNKNKKIKIKNLENFNDFIYIDDVINLFKKSISSKSASGIYNVGTGKAVSIKSIFNYLLRKLGKIEDFDQKKYFKNEKIKSLSDNFWADISITKTNFKWIPKHTIETGIDKMLKKLKIVKND